jgi:hypothetical protein
MTLVYKMDRIKRWISQVVTTMLGKVLNRLDFKEKGGGLSHHPTRVIYLQDLCPLLDVSVVIT